MRVYKLVDNSKKETMHILLPSRILLKIYRLATHNRKETPSNKTPVQRFETLSHPWCACAVRVTVVGLMCVYKILKNKKSP